MFSTYSIRDIPPDGAFQTFVRVPVVLQFSSPWNLRCESFNLTYLSLEKINQEFHVSKKKPVRGKPAKLVAVQT